MNLNDTPPNWLWLMSVRPGHKVLVDRSIVATVGPTLAALGADALPLQEGPLDVNLGPLADAALLGFPNLEQGVVGLASRLLDARRNLKVGAEVAIIGDGKRSILRFGGLSVGEAREAASRAGLLDISAFLASPSASEMRCLVPDSRAASSAFLDLDRGISRLSSLRSLAARCGLTRFALPAYVVFART